MKKVMTVSVLDQNLTVRSDSNEDQLTRVSDFVNQKIREVTSKAKNASTLTAALLACMNIANEYLQLREAQAEAQNKVRELVGLVASQGL